MGKNIWGISTKTRGMGLGSSSGRTVGNTRGTGRRGNSMGWGYTGMPRGRRRRESGWMGVDSPGCLMRSRTTTTRALNVFENIPLKGFN